MNLFGALVLWQGLFVGAEHTAPVRTPLLQPSVSASATALVSVGRVTTRAVYIQPLQARGYGPAMQVGFSVRLF
jgi:hypothetical protein